MESSYFYSKYEYKHTQKAQEGDKSLLNISVVREAFFSPRTPPPGHEFAKGIPAPDGGSSGLPSLVQNTGGASKRNIGSGGNVPLGCHCPVGHDIHRLKSSHLPGTVLLL